MSSLGNMQGYYNGFISSSRNVFLTSSVAIAMFGFSNSFKISTSSIIVRFASTFVFIFALLYGLITVVGMKRYIRNLRRSDQRLPLNIQIDLWEHHANLLSVYLFLLVVLCFIGLRRFVYFMN